MANGQAGGERPQNQGHKIFWTTLLIVVVTLIRSETCEESRPSLRVVASVCSTRASRHRRSVLIEVIKQGI